MSYSKTTVVKKAGKAQYKPAVKFPKLLSYPRAPIEFTLPSPMMNMRTGGFLGKELKFYDTSLVGSALVTNNDAASCEFDPATVLCLSAPAQGDGESDRDGNRFIVKSCYVNGQIVCAQQADQTAADGTTWTVLYLVQDKQSNGAQLNSEDVFKNIGASTTTGACVMRNLQYSSRFRILDSVKVVFDRSAPMTYDGTNIEQGGMLKTFKLSWKGNMPVQIKAGATSAGVAGVADNSIHVLAFTYQPSPLAASLSYTSRIRFVG